MADLIAQGAAWLTNQRRASASQTVTYSRGTASVSISAAIGNSAFTLDNGNVVLNLESRDYLFAAADLVLNGNAVTPLPGDRITEADGQVYEVLPIAGEPAWRYSDNARTSLRVHTRQVESGA